MTSCREKFQELLRELFQFDCADLDFGIYRIMNHKRDVIEKFITQDLPRAITDEVDRDALADQSQAAKGLKEVADQITQTLGKDALDADGNLAATYYGTPLGTKYLNLKAKAAGGLGREALEASIFNHLYTFFSRYYQDGDFISKRRYSKRQRYAIPYNGEEVYLYWANNDQYYVKTAEHFHDYTFSSHGVTVHFKLQAATVEQNNVKGDKRFFLPRAPGRMATEEDFNRGPRIVKYIRIESYEDALNNIDFDDGSGQQALKFDVYMLKYMLKWETRASETLLNVENLARPFGYKLRIHGDGQIREKVAEIPETFHYLLGLHVQTRRVYDDDGRRYLVYRGKTDHRQIVVIWRETEDWQKADLERDKKFVAEKKLTEGADEIFVNGDSFIPNAKALEPVFKARMFAEVQA